jgi:predicted membrane protein
MKYLIRSVKYFLSFALIFFLIIVILVLTTDGATLATVFSPESGMFKAGSFPKILAFFIAVAAIYPALSYVKKETFVTGTYQENEEAIRMVFENYGYELVSEDNETATFRLRSKFTRLMRMYEDPITITKGESPLILSGYRRDIFRLASGIQYAALKREEE